MISFLAAAETGQNKYKERQTGAVYFPDFLYFANHNWVVEEEEEVVI